MPKIGVKKAPLAAPSFRCAIAVLRSDIFALVHAYRCVSNVSGLPPFFLGNENDSNSPQLHLMGGGGGESIKGQNTQLGGGAPQGRNE